MDKTMIVHLINGTLVKFTWETIEEKNTMLEEVFPLLNDPEIFFVRFVVNKKLIFKHAIAMIEY